MMVVASIGPVSCGAAEVLEGIDSISEDIAKFAEALTKGHAPDGEPDAAVADAIADSNSGSKSSV